MKNYDDVYAEIRALVARAKLKRLILPECDGCVTNEFECLNCGSYYEPWAKPKLDLEIVLEAIYRSTGTEVKASRYAGEMFCTLSYIDKSGRNRFVRWKYGACLTNQAHDVREFVSLLINLNK